MEAFTFAVSTHVEFPIHIKMYVDISKKESGLRFTRRLTADISVEL